MLILIYVYLSWFSYFSLTVYCTCIDFKTSFRFVPGDLNFCICAKKELYLLPYTRGYVLFFFNNCFTRVNRRLVNSFSYSNRIFWSRENVITKCKNKQIRAKRFRLYIFNKHCDLWNQQYIFALGEVVASKIKCIIKI